MKKFFVSVMVVFVAIFAAVTDSFAASSLRGVDQAAVESVGKRDASAKVGLEKKKISAEEQTKIWFQLAKSSFEKQNKDRLTELGVTYTSPVVSKDGIFYGCFVTVKTKGYDTSLVTDSQLRGVNMDCTWRFKIPGTDEERKTALDAVFKWAGARANRGKVLWGLQVRLEGDKFIGWTILYKFGPPDMPPPVFGYIPVEPVTLGRGYKVKKPVIMPPAK